MPPEDHYDQREALHEARGARPAAPLSSAHCLTCAGAGEVYSCDAGGGHMAKCATCGGTGAATQSLNIRPRQCCAMGSYECQVPMPLNGRLQSIDFCLADIVAALNAANIRTVASCCGHGEIDGNILLEDGRIIWIKNGVRPWENKDWRTLQSEAMDTKEDIQAKFINEGATLIIDGEGGRIAIEITEENQKLAEALFRVVLRQKGGA